MALFLFPFLHNYMDLTVAHKNNVPLLFVFNNKKSMDSFRKEVQPFVKNELLLIDSHNFNDDLKNIIKNFKIVGITQQRFRDMAIGYGDFSFFHIGSLTLDG
ncbi:hypothetical protein [Parageobacillus thermoglucosidasius]|uniref:Uncharacterized protein n=1 Tax=Parageobacillus thermoglucosidasius TaxID=1426 RepID=A0AB38R463_PARTM|nr:hypothetical protein [Parageobacillus thermoglucosidasius]UOE77537.1 hypothetical protein IMI45_06875 [Parageobacillus thermoglucosidasius]